MTKERLAVILIILFIGGLRSDDDCGIQNLQDKIIAGEATAIDEYPWIALIRYKEPTSQVETWGCGGSLVGKKTILTAAHCVDSDALKTLGEIQFVRLGEYDYTKDIDCVKWNNGEDCADKPVDIKVINSLIYPERNSKSRLHDIAILILETEPQYTDFVRPICLPESSSSSNDVNGVLFVAGWGWTVGFVSSPSDIKRHVQVEYVNKTQCHRFYNNIDIDDKWQICAGGKEGRSPCRGDSGGPLMYSTGNKWTLTGIVSYGPSSCGIVGIDGKPAVFTRVSSYLPWIKSVLLSLIEQDKVLWEK